MATSNLKSNVEARKQARLAKQAATAAPVLQGKQTDRSVAYAKGKAVQAPPTARQLRTTPTASQSSAPTSVPSPANATPMSGDFSAFQSDVLRMVSQMPPGQARDQILSAFAQIQALPASDQKKWFDALMTQAKTATDPQYQQDKTRMQQDYGYEQQGIQRAQQFAQENYNRLIEQVDFNRLREKAQDNKVLADVLARVTSDSFVTNVAGSGIISRRNQAARYEAKQIEEGKDIAVSQTKADAAAALSQFQAGKNAELSRSKQLQERGEFDLSQENLYNTQSLFLDLFKNEVADTSAQVQRNVGAEAAMPAAAPVKKGVTNPLTGKVYYDKAGERLQSRLNKRGL
jgi:hypothetical protein